MPASLVQARFGRRDCSSKALRQSYLTNIGTFIFNDTLMSLLSVSSLLFVVEAFN